MSWPKTLSVDKQIVSLLSASTYEHFPKAIREVVSNSFDADATRVDITFSLSDGTLIAVDNGSGMTPEEFDFYLRIAGHRSSRAPSRLGRKRIGRFGIGFLAMFPFCEQLEVESTTAQSPTVFKAVIPASRFTSPATRPVDVTETEIEGFEFLDESKRDEHYTRLVLRGLTPLVRRYFDDGSPDANLGPSVRKWPGMQRLRWELGETLPVAFGRDSVLADALGEPLPTLTVMVNGAPVLRNDHCREVLASRREFTISGVRCRYAFGTPWMAVHPYEARGAKIRLSGVGIGDRTNFDLQIHGRTFSRLHWLSGEIEILEGLEESLALNRDSFTSTDQFDAFRDHFQGVLREMAYKVEAIDTSVRVIRKATKAGTAFEPDGVATEKIEILRKQGFKIETRQSPSTRGSSIEVDLPSRTVVIRPNHPDAKSIPGAFRERWEEWNPENETWPACRFAPDGSGFIEYNRRYGPFRTGTAPQVDVLRRVHRAILTAWATSEVPESDIRLVQQGILRELERSGT